MKEEKDKFEAILQERLRKEKEKKEAEVRERIRLK